MGVVRWCLGCRRRGEWATGRCPACTTSAERTARKRALYGPTYRAVRRQWAKLIAAGARVLCPRCGEPVTLRFDLGHGADGNLRPEHPTCNRSAGGKGIR